MGNKVGALFGSRRFYAAVGGVLVVVLNENFGVSADQAQLIVYTVGAWIIGDSISKTTG